MQQLLLAVDEGVGVVSGNFKIVAVRDGIARARFHAVPAKNAAIVIDVVDLGVAFGGRDALLGGVLGGFNIDAIGGAGGGAEETGHAFFQSVFVALEDVGAAIALLEDRAAQRALAVRIIFHLDRLEDLPEGDAHAFGDAGDVARYRHEAIIQ